MIRRGLGVTAMAACLGLLIAPRALAGDAAVSYPDGYRGWTFLHSALVPAGYVGFGKSPCVKPCTNGIFYFYANEQAMKGLRTGSYVDGSAIAVEMLEYLVAKKGTAAEGKRVLTSVMVKDGQRYAATGGWGFGNFDEGSKVNTLDDKAQQSCFQCHSSRKDSDLVFSRYTER